MEVSPEKWGGALNGLFVERNCRPSLRINLSSNSKHTKKQCLATSTHPRDCVSGRAWGFGDVARPFVGRGSLAFKNEGRPQWEGGRLLLPRPTSLLGEMGFFAGLGRSRIGMVKPKYKRGAGMGGGSYI